MLRPERPEVTAVSIAGETAKPNSGETAKPNSGETAKPKRESRRLPALVRDALTFTLPMLEPAIPADEEQRLALLKACNIIYTPAEEAFDDVARLAAELCDAEIALITLVDADYQWFKARVGVHQIGTPRDLSFCGHCTRFCCRSGGAMKKSSNASRERLAC
jgi:hypothetical protein